MATIFPQTADQITPEWIGASLARRWPGVAVTNMTILREITGTSLKLRVALDYNDAGNAAGLPPTMIIKGSFTRQDPILDFIFVDEMRAYRDLIPDIGLNAPDCYFSDQEGRNPVMFLEDLTDRATFGSPFVPLSFDQMAQMLDTVARLHAANWASPELADDARLGWITRSVTGDHLAHFRNQLQPDRWAFYRSLPHGAGVPYAMASDPARLERLMDRQWAWHRRDTLTVGHGDCHIANLYFNDRGGGLFDWQLRRCPWYHDVSYLITSSLDIVDRRAWEAALLQHYLGRLRDHGVEAPAFDDAWYQHRREQIYGYIVFMLNGDGSQYWTEAANTICAARFAMAAEDLETVKAIERDEVF